MKAAAEARGDVRCPACARLLVLRSGPKVTPHYAHRPRQSCRNRRDGAGRAPLRLEQLTLFELAPVGPPPEPPPEGPAIAAAVSHPSVRRARRRRRRRRAWLPRLRRWLSAARGPASPGLHP